MKWILLFSLLWLFSTISFAQNALLQLSVSHQRDTSREFSGLDNFNVQRLESKLRVPVLAISSFAGSWYGGFELTENRLLLSGSTNDTRRFYRFAMPFEFEMRPSGRWQHVLNYTPSHYSDESLIDQTRFVNEFSWLVKYKANRKARWVMGIRQDTRFGAKSLYPVFGLESRPNSKFYHHWVFPDVYSHVILNKKVGVRVFAKPNGGNWRYLETEGGVASLGMTDWNVGMAWIQALRHPLQFKMEVGLKMLGEGSVSGNDGDLADGYFFLFSVQTKLL